MSFLSEYPQSGPELSIIVPVLDEIDELPKFLSNILLQQAVQFEIIFADGGSGDGTLHWLANEQCETSCIKVVSSPRGRGRQLNTGFSAALGQWLLFLHVDSRFDDELALHDALAMVKRAPYGQVAGHFPLRFRRSSKSASFPYYFYEAKTVTNRPETVHGDQGFLFHREFYSLVGDFDSSLPVMEDTDYAERVRQLGEWIALPADLSTSARRFETEGLWQRQLLGALIMCFRSIGWHAFFEQAADVYRLQGSADKLLVLPFFNLVKDLLSRLPDAERRQIWSLAGSYVRGHAWQLFFCIDSLVAYLLGKPPRQVQPLVTSCCEPVYDFITNNRAGCWCATMLLKGWFYVTAFILGRLEKHEQRG